jgi:hypothetical protein
VITPTFIDDSSTPYLSQNWLLMNKSSVKSTHTM